MSRADRQREARHQRAFPSRRFAGAAMSPCSKASSPLRLLLAGCLALLVLALPGLARAVTPYTITWIHKEYTGSSESTDLKQNDGTAFFDVNGTPIPSYQERNAAGEPNLIADSDGSHITVNAPFDSVLLVAGTNVLSFGVRNMSGDDSQVHAHETATLDSNAVNVHVLLLDAERHGTALAGSAPLQLTLEQINPPLAADIANLEKAIEAERQTLISNASKIEDLASKLAVLNALDKELSALADKPLEDIDPSELDAILHNYGSVVDAATKAALEQFLADLQKSLADLQAELANLVGVFGAQADAAADLIAQTAQQAGFDPEAQAGYLLGQSDVPLVDMPDVSGVQDAWSAGKDPYAAYADAVLAALGEDVVDGKVADRADFVAQVRAWQKNQKALAAALKMNGASKEETSAFLNAQNQVTAYVKQFMNAQGWFNDCAAPPEVRAVIDGPLKQAFGQLAEDLKDAVNDLIPCEQQLLCAAFAQRWQTIEAFGSAIGAIGNAAAPYLEMMQTVTQTTAHMALGLVPVVGTYLDFCEAVTGRAFCLPDGAELTDEERIFAGAGVAVSGVATFWGAVKGAKLIGAKGAAVAGVIGKVDEDVAQALHAQALLKPAKALPVRGAIKTLINAFEEKVAVAMEKKMSRIVKGIGDDGVRDVLQFETLSGGGKLAACDFLSITKEGRIVLTEAKAPLDGTLKVKNLTDAREQLWRTVEQTQKRGLAGALGEDYKS